MNILKLRAHRFKLLLAALVAALLMLVSGPTPSRAQSCITTLPLTYSLSSYYAASWTHELDIFVKSNGPTITGLSVSLSTFNGSILGKGTLSGALNTGGSTIHVKLQYPMQPGTFTLYFYGFPNADPSCGPKHRGAVLHLTGCTGSLPVSISGATEGLASAYGRFYSFNVAPKGGQLLKGLSATISTFNGAVVGRKAIPVLFGNLRVAIPLHTGIAPAPTKYTLAVGGFVNGRPKSCGPLQARRTLVFH